MEGSKLVYGAAKISSIDKSSAYKILDKLYENNVREIDTAPTYEASEKHLGDLIHDFSRFKINSKVGADSKGNFDSTTIKESVYKSLENLKVNSLNVLFIHSVPYSLLNDSAFEALNNLKDEGLYKKLGYSGDGTNLHSLLARNTAEIQSLMFSYNFLDQSNLEIINEGTVGTSHYVKRVLANGVWKKRNPRDITKDLLGLTRGHDEYRNRFKILYPHGLKNAYSLSIDFVQRNIPEAKYLIGITSLKQCNNLLAYLTKPEFMDLKKLEEMSETYKAISSNYNFNSVT